MLKSISILFIILSTLFISCQSKVDFHVIANRKLNPNLKGQISVPVLLQIYQLRDDAKFREAGYFELIDSPEKTLGADYILPVKALMVSPNEQMDFSVNLNSDTKYLGVVAAFQAIESSEWKSILPLAGSHKSIEIKIKGKHVSANPY